MCVGRQNVALGLPRKQISDLQGHESAVSAGPRGLARLPHILVVNAMINAAPPPDGQIEQEDPARSALSTVVQRIVELSNRLLDWNVAKKDVWFRNLLLGVLNSAQRDYRSVEVGVKKSPYLAAWGGRNLLNFESSRHTSSRAKPMPGNFKRTSSATAQNSGPR